MAKENEGTPMSKNKNKKNDEKKSFSNKKSKRLHSDLINLKVSHSSISLYLY
jgi:hypothetical protein